MAKDYNELRANLEDLRLTCEIKRELCMENPKRILKQEATEEIYREELQTIDDAVDAVKRLTEIEEIVDKFFEDPSCEYAVSAGYFSRILKVIRRKNNNG